MNRLQRATIALAALLVVALVPLAFALGPPGKANIHVAPKCEAASPAAFKASHDVDATPPKDTISATETHFTPTELTYSSRSVPVASFPLLN
jgi:hypothetical protein